MKLFISLLAKHFQGRFPTSEVYITGYISLSPPCWLLDEYVSMFDPVGTHGEYQKCIHVTRARACLCINEC